MNEKNKHFNKDEHSLSSFNMCIINNTRRESLSYFFSYAHHYGVAIKSPEIWTSQYPAINFNWASKKKVQNSKENKHVKYYKADTRSGGVEIPMYSRMTQHDKVMCVCQPCYTKMLLHYNLNLILKYRLESCTLKNHAFGFFL